MRKKRERRARKRQVSNFCKGNSRDRCTLSKCRTLQIPSNAIPRERTSARSKNTSTYEQFPRLDVGIGGLAEEPLLGPGFYRAFRRFEYQALETQTRREDAGGDVALFVRSYARLHVHLRYSLVLPQLQSHPWHFWLFGRAQRLCVLCRTARGRLRCRRRCRKDHCRR